MTPKLITAKWLREKGPACSEVAIFEKEWPDGGRLTLTNLRRAAVLNLDLHWFARAYLPDSLRKEYSRKVAPLWEEYNQKVALLWVEYNQKVTLLLWSVLKKGESHATVRVTQD